MVDRVVLRGVSMRILGRIERFWTKVYPGTEDGHIPVEAVCPCESCNRRPLPTGRMIRRDGTWFCSEKAYFDFVFVSGRFSE
jgi:hypothetical protein